MSYGCLDEVVLVVGATRGIGRAAAVNLAAAGATVIVTGRAKGAAQSLADELGGSASALQFDVRDPGAAEDVMGSVIERHGHIDALVLSAGVNPHFVRPQDVTPDIWDEVFATNTRGAFFTIQAAARSMLERGAGSIVTVSSVTAQVGIRRGLPYVATKGALDAMTRSLAVEWAGQGIRVNAVAPGYIATDLTEGVRNHEGIAGSILARTPLGRFGRSEEVAGLITYLVSDDSTYVTGQVFAVDGGMSVW